jgi:hypothetical protein
MSSLRDPETGLTSRGDTTEAKCDVFQKIKKGIADSYFASYTSLRILLNTEWKDFLNQKYVDNGKFLTRWPILVAYGPDTI